MTLVTFDDLPGYSGASVATERQQAASTVVEVVEARLAGELRRPIGVASFTDEVLSTVVSPAGYVELSEGPVVTITAVSIDYQNGTTAALGSSFWRRGRGGLLFTKPFPWADYPELLSISYTAGLDTTDADTLAALRSCAVPACVRVLGRVTDGTVSVDRLVVEGMTIVPAATRHPGSGFTADEWAGVAALARP